MPNDIVAIPYDQYQGELPEGVVPYFEYRGGDIRPAHGEYANGLGNTVRYADQVGSYDWDIDPDQLVPAFHETTESVFATEEKPHNDEGRFPNAAPPEVNWPTVDEDEIDKFLTETPKPRGK